MDTNLPFDIYGLVPYVDYLKIILVSILFLCVLVGVWFLLKQLISKLKKKKVKISTKSVLELLEEIILKVKIKSICEDEGKFYENITMLFREGLELGLGFSATSMTVVEIRKYIMESLFDDKDKIEIMQFFKISDLVKFSSHTTTQQDRTRYQNQVEVWLTQIKTEVERKIQEEERKKQIELDISKDKQGLTSSRGVETKEIKTDEKVSLQDISKRDN